MSSFESGFNNGLAMWRDGSTAESISNSVNCDASEYGCGLHAASEALMGWLDLAERSAKACGVSKTEWEALRASAERS